jgi:hypothetical protein
MIKQLKNSSLPNKKIFLDSYIFHRHHQLNDINMNMLDDETKHEIHCRVMALLLKKVSDEP